MISVAISCHYFFGKDQRTAELEKILPRFPPWAFPSYWVSTYNMYRYWGTARHHSASQRQMPRRVVTCRAAVQSREQRYQALVRRTEPWGLFHTDTIESIHTNAHTLKHTHAHPNKRSLPAGQTHITVSGGSVANEQEEELRNPPDWTDKRFYVLFDLCFRRGKRGGGQLGVRGWVLGMVLMEGEGGGGMGSFIWFKASNQILSFFFFFYKWSENEFPRSLSLAVTVGSWWM